LELIATEIDGSGASLEFGVAFMLRDGMPITVRGLGPVVEISS
jgi:hypothetical protein